MANSMLRCIQRQETDPYYNLAAEEYLLKTATTDSFMTWRNEPCVIIGKHQNANREINHAFIESEKLPVIRRITGGGAVYHDLGNINFSFIYTDRTENMVDFRHFTEPVILFLLELGIHASFEEKSNICAGRFKISGNSAHILKNKVLHHGTLLFNTDLEALENAIGGHENNYEDKSVRSVRSNVANISKLLQVKISEDEFINLFLEFIFKNYPGSYTDKLNSIEERSVLKLSEEKYKKTAWNYGYSPDYKYTDEWMISEGKYSILLIVRNGLIDQAELTGPDHHLPLLKAISDHMTGGFHEKKSLLERLEKINFAVKDKFVVNQVLQHLF